MTRQNFATTVDRFLKALAAKDLTLRTARVEDVREAIGAITSAKSSATSRQYAQRVKSLLGYAHRLGYLAFNAGVTIRTMSGGGDLAKRMQARPRSRC